MEKERERTPSKELFPTAIREKRFPLVEAGKKITREGGTIQFIFLCASATFSCFLRSLAGLLLAVFAIAAFY
jgi:hypothetical protein